MRFIKRHHFYLITLPIVLVTFYNEVLTYFIQSYKWPSLECSNNVGCVKILLVADPQILGEQSENPLFTLIFNWDSDRFLAKTYAHVVPYFNPDAIIFLGDITDEGSIATKEEFYRYIQRLPSIFNSEYPIKHVWLPGDNDIGGENEPIYVEKIKMFNAAFKQPDIISVKSVDIYKTNYLTQLLPESTADFHSSNSTKIAISHMPLLLTRDTYTMNVLTQVQPSAIFSGHRHSASYLVASKQSSYKTNKVRHITPQDSDQIMKIDLKLNEFHEFIVPTCSYRMGMKNIGYGAATIDTVNQKLQFSVLWSPQRFFHIALYLIPLIVLTVYLFMLIIYKILALISPCVQAAPYTRV